MATGGTRVLAGAVHERQAALMRRSCRNRRSTAKDGSGGLVALGNRALGINRHLGLVGQVGDALGSVGTGSAVTSAAGSGSTGTSPSSAPSSSAASSPFAAATAS